MAGKGKSRQGLFGTVHHYDEHGREIGKSKPGFFGSYTNYDAKGNMVGHSKPGMFGSYHHYDTRGRKTGRSDPGMFGSYHHKDSRGKPVGSSKPGFFDSYHHSGDQGCYIATCIYGSYDCPQVWTLRRFRDDTLAASRPGRAFIRTYYALSPAVVARFGKCGWFRNLWKFTLDSMVHRLNRCGVQDTPYCDKVW